MRCEGLRNANAPPTVLSEWKTALPSQNAKRGSGIGGDKSGLFRPQDRPSHQELIYCFCCYFLQPNAPADCAGPPRPGRKPTSGVRLAAQDEAPAARRPATLWRRTKRAVRCGDGAVANPAGADKKRIRCRLRGRERGRLAATSGPRSFVSGQQRWRSREPGIPAPDQKRPHPSRRDIARSQA